MKKLYDYLITFLIGKTFHVYTYTCMHDDDYGVRQSMSYISRKKKNELKTFTEKNCAKYLGIYI